MKKQNGITLIALVISIIVMLILVGVSINAIVGENGVLSRAQYSSFMNEMVAVEEAVQLWKAGELIESKGQVDTAIPANGLCNVNELTATERLVGEVGYYRTWSIGNTMPEMSILTSADTFNKKYEGEFVFYPAGVQDLYYLNNEALGLDEGKVYLIDAATSMVYSMSGITLNGIRCYSTSMAKAVTSGINTAPIFAEAEVSGTGTGEKLAGNVTSQYLMDENGNYILDATGEKILNPDYNPNGFQIIANSNSNNIFKLYNNGDLYGKGLKGTQLNTSVEEMEKINAYKWQEWNVPENIGEVKKIVVGCNAALYFIDANDDLWVLGSNSTNNKFGLTQNQSVEYTGREAIKVDLGTKKVKKIYPGWDVTFIITVDNLLYAAGRNDYGQLGFGNTNSTTIFEQVNNIKDVDKIEKIYLDSIYNYSTVIKYTDGTYYFSGINNYGGLGTGKTGEQYTTFTQIWNGDIGPDIDQDIKDLAWGCQTIILRNNGTVWIAGYTGYIMENLLENNGNKNFSQMNILNVDSFVRGSDAGFIFIVNGDAGKEYWCVTSKYNICGTDYYGYSYPTKMELPEDLMKEGIAEIYGRNYSNFYILSNTGKLYGCGDYTALGMDIKSGNTKGIIYLGIDNVETMYDSKIETDGNFAAVVILKRNNKYYMTASSTLMFGNRMLQQNWAKVAENVQYFDGFSSCYVDSNNDLWVAGDSRYCALGTNSETYSLINNYVKCTDVNISGKVKKSYESGLVRYVLLNNDELWATGMYINNGTKYYPGWEGTDNKYEFVKIMDNVKFFDCTTTYYNKLAITNTGEAYTWGVNFGSATGSSASYLQDNPQKYTLPSEIGGIDNIYKIQCYNWQRTALITNDGKMFLTGTWDNPAFDGGHIAKNYFSQYTTNLTLEENEKIVNFAGIDGNNGMILTNKKRLFGWGNAKYLGIGNASSEEQMTRLINLEGIEQIVAGNGFYIAVKNDGTVWGTGSNTCGILGRWIGIDRNSPNSRYKTAFEWVECPELEI